MRTLLSTLLTFTAIGIVLVMTAFEIVKYRNPQHHFSTGPYTKRRFSRRIGMSILLIAIVLLFYLMPEHLSVMTELMWITTELALVALLVLLAIRDLRETSAAIVREHQQFLSEAEREMLSSIPEIQARKAAAKRKSKG